MKVQPDVPSPSLDPDIQALVEASNSYVVDDPDNPLTESDKAENARVQEMVVQFVSAMKSVRIKQADYQGSAGADFGQREEVCLRYPADLSSSVR